MEKTYSETLEEIEAEAAQDIEESQEALKEVAVPWEKVKEDITGSQYEV